MEFVKVHGAGNDFVLLPDLDDRIELTAPLVRALCRPHTGLGADGVIRVAPARVGVQADVFMDYWNADGTVAESCGNGVRCVAKYVIDHAIVRHPIVRVDTRGGARAVVATLGDDGFVERVRVDMGTPEPGKVDWRLEPEDASAPPLIVTTLSMGNPHAVVVVDDVDSAPVDPVGPALQRHPAFPDGANVEFIEVESRGVIRGRIWERGVGETLASGTGASAMAAAAVMLGLTDRTVRVVLPGGELEVDWTGDTLFQTGPAAEVASGVVGEAWLAGVGHA